MIQGDRPEWGDIAAAIGLLTRLPVRVDTERAQSRGAGAAWAYPLAGLALGAIGALVAQVALWFGVPGPLAAGLSLSALVLTSGAMHEDGLADTADGLWGGWTTDRRLDIMKDSRIGVYGVVALVLALGLRWLALGLIIDANALWAGIVVAATLSRAAMVPIMAALPHARAGGLSRSVGRPAAPLAWIALSIGAICTVVLCPGAALWILINGALAAAGCAAVARAKIGGQTGDILGATQQVTEIVILVTLATLLA